MSEIPSNDMSPEPRFPILDWQELGDTLHDRRTELPETLQHIHAQLTPDDYVIYIETPEIKQSTLPPAATREILRLCNASQPSEIGDYGAAVAGLSSIENQDVAALRKFEVAHGRDALEIALKLHHYHPELLRATILELASTQGIEQEAYAPGVPYRHEEPGRIILLNRDQDDPIGQKFSRRLNWGFPFYGSIDATPTFISAIAQYVKNHAANNFLEQRYQGKDGAEYTVADALDRSVGWVLQRLDQTPDGLLEFHNPDQPGKGMAAQAWKDSPFAYVHADGSRANYNDGIASVEVQAFAYDALRDAADLYQTTQPDQADVLRSRADELRKKIFDTFWVDHPTKGEFFALATDRDENGCLRTLDVRSSNMGRLLHSRLLEGNEPHVLHMRNETVRQLFTPGMLAAAGIRTLASDEKAYRANSYHTGSVWMWDSDACADGLERHNFHHLAWELRRRSWQTVQTTGKFPEFVTGDTDSISTNPSEVYVYNQRYNILHLFEQPTQEVQGWSVSAILANKRKYLAYKKQRASLPTSPFELAILGQVAP